MLTSLQNALRCSSLQQLLVHANTPRARLYAHDGDFGYAVDARCFNHAQRADTYASITVQIQYFFW